MMTFYEEIIKESDGNCNIMNITDDAARIASKSGIKNGLVTVFSIGSTSCITTIEYEPGLLKDLPALMERLVPSFSDYKHNDTWGDGNGHSHLRSALMKTSLSVPLVNRELVLGTWQQIIYVDFDNRKRTRRIAVQILGE